MDNPVIELSNLLELRDNKIRALEAQISTMEEDLSDLRQTIRRLYEYPYDPYDLQAMFCNQYEREIGHLRGRNFELTIELENCQSILNKCLQEAQNNEFFVPEGNKEGKGETSEKRSRTINFLEKWKGKKIAK